MLFAAIAFEIVGTTALKMSDSFTHSLYAVITVIGYAGSFSFFIKVLEHMSLGLAYGIWGGFGTVCTSIIGIIFWGDIITPLMGIGMCLIIVGIILLNKGTDELEAQKQEGQ